MKDAFLGLAPLQPTSGVVPPLACAIASGLLAGYILVLPTAGTVALRNLLFFSLFLLTLFAAWRWRLRLRLPVAIGWLVFAVVALASIAYAINPAYSAGEVKSEVGYGVIATMLGATWIRTESDFKKFLTVFVLGAVLMAVGGCVQFAVLLARGMRFNDMRIGSLHSGMGTFSTYISMVFPFVLGAILLRVPAGVHRGWLITLCVLLLFCAVITRNRMVVPVLFVQTMVVVTVVYFGRLNRSAKRNFVIAAIMLAISTIALFLLLSSLRAGSGGFEAISDSLKADPRWKIWSTAVHNIQEHPWAGGGFGRRVFTWINPSLEAESHLHWHSHNAFLDMGVQMGVPGIIAFVLLLVLAVVAITPNKHALAQASTMNLRTQYACGLALIIGLVLKNSTDDFWIRDHVYMFWLLVGAIAGTVDHANSEALTAMAPPHNDSLHAHANLG